jgi:hypothetical protein
MSTQVNRLQQKLIKAQAVAKKFEEQWQQDPGSIDRDNDPLAAADIRVMEIKREIQNLTNGSQE